MRRWIYFQNTVVEVSRKHEASTAWTTSNEPIHSSMHLMRLTLTSPEGSPDRHYMILYITPLEFTPLEKKYQNGRGVMRREHAARWYPDKAGDISVPDRHRLTTESLGPRSSKHYIQGYITSRGLHIYFNMLPQSWSLLDFFGHNSFTCHCLDTCSCYDIDGHQEESHTTLAFQAITHKNSS